MNPDDGERRGARGAAIFRALQSAGGFLGAQELHRGLVESGSGTGLATVYRHLRAFAADGRAETVRTAQGELYRAIADPTRTHLHLVCDSCGAADEIAEPLAVAAPNEEWVTEIGDRHGFRVARHTVEVHGQCARCG